MDFRDWSSDMNGGLGRLDRLNDLGMSGNKLGSRQGYRDFADTDMSSLVNYLSGDVSTGFNGMDYSGNLPIGNPFIGANPVTGVSRSLPVLPNRHIANSLNPHQHTSNEDFFRTLYKSDTKNSLQQPTSTKMNQYNFNEQSAPSSLKASSLESLIHSLNMEYAKTNGNTVNKFITNPPASSVNIAELSNHPHALLGRPAVASNNIYKLLSGNNAMYTPGRTPVSRLPEKFANLLATSHADDLLRSLEQTSDTNSVYTYPNSPVASPNIQSADNVIESYFSNMRTSSLPLKRNEVYNKTVNRIDERKHSNLSHLNEEIIKRYLLPNINLDQYLHTKQWANNNSLKTEKEGFVDGKFANKLSSVWYANNLLMNLNPENKGSGREQMRSVNKNIVGSKSNVLNELLKRSMLPIPSLPYNKRNVIPILDVPHTLNATSYSRNHLGYLHGNKRQKEDRHDRYICMFFFCVIYIEHVHCHNVFACCSS